MKKVYTTLFFVASVCYYIVAIGKMIASGFSSSVIWLCLGSAFLCLGASSLNRMKKSGDAEEESEEKQ